MAKKIRVKTHGYDRTVLFRIGKLEISWVVWKKYDFPNINSQSIVKEKLNGK